MLIGYNWLKEYIEIPFSCEELADRLTMIGLEIGGIYEFNKGLDRCKVGKIVEIKHHPNADNLSICLVDVGGTELTIVCGASNMKTGDRVPVALPGANLSKVGKIEKTSIRGIPSEGMLCSHWELDLGTDRSGLMILPSTAPIGIALAVFLGVSEKVLEIDLTPNRSDCLSHLGIAREIAAITQGTLTPLEINFKEEGESIHNFIDVQISAPDLCHRYSARVITGVNVQPSPLWLMSRLESVGIRSINNIVDITNFLLMETGQPLHAFDYDLIKGKKIIVRPAKQGESFQTLDGIDRDFDNSMLMIADAYHPVALAGIMGGIESEVTENTKNILIESAFFNPCNIRRTSRKLRLSTEASQRFERGIDPEGVLMSADRATHLISKLAGGIVAKDAIDVYPRPGTREPIKVSTERLNKILGIDLPSKKIYSILEGLSFKPLSGPSNTMEFIPPSFRQDIFKEIDIVEEVARFYGYNKIPVTIPSGTLPIGEKLSKKQRVRNLLRDFLKGVGFYECINFSFTDKRLFDIIRFDEGSKTNSLMEIRNPLNEEQNVLRQSIVPGLIQNVVFNQSRFSYDIKIFEIGTCFFPAQSSSEPPEENERLAILMTGHRNKRHWLEDENDFNFYDIKGLIELLFEYLRIDDYSFGKVSNDWLDKEESLKVVCGKTQVCAFGCISYKMRELFDLRKKTVFLAELDVDALCDLSSPCEYKYQSIPKFPPVLRDMAIVIDEKVPFEDIINLIRKEGGELLKDVDLFDVYIGQQVPKGKKSLAFALTYRSSQRTLTDEEINKAHENIIKKLNLYLKAELR